MNATARNERGQVTVMAAIFMVILVGLAGIVLDVGSWFRQQRASQSTVDAAALAGAQALPDTATANGLATDYATSNAGIDGARITFSSRYSPDDTITVTQSNPANGFFSRLFGVNIVTISTKAAAISAQPTEVLGAAPIVVDIAHKMLSGNGCPCFGIPTSIPLGKKGVPGAFGMIDLNLVHSGNTGTSTLADWILNGFDQYLPLGNYDSDPGAKFNSSQVQDALAKRSGSDLLFPVFDTLTGNGSHATYHVIGWAAFHVTRATASGSTGDIYGWFDRVIWQGIVPPKNPPSPALPDLGVRSVALID